VKGVDAPVLADAHRISVLPLISVDKACIRRFETLLWGEAIRFCGLIY